MGRGISIQYQWKNEHVHWKGLNPNLSLKFYQQSAGASKFGHFRVSVQTWTDIVHANTSYLCQGTRGNRDI